MIDNEDNGIFNFYDSRKLHYMSPENLKDDIYNEKSDVWVVGIILYEMLFGIVPWMGVDKKE